MRSQPARAAHASKITTKNKNIVGLRPVFLRRAVIIIGCALVLGVLTPNRNLLSNFRQSTMALDQAQITKGVNQFGSELFNLLEQDESSSARFLSPWGIAHAMAMLLEGAETRSTSHQQIQEVIFGIKESDAGSALGASLKDLTHSITKASDGEVLTVADANSAWVGKGLELNPAFKRALETLFNAQARPLISADEVNAWVSKATHEKIQTIIDDGAAREAALILVNAIYFKGLWEAPFSKDDTVRLPFHLMTSGSTVDSPHMYIHYKKGKAIQGAKLTASLQDAGKTLDVPCVAVKMAYKGGAYSAVLAMPLGQLDHSSGAARLTLEGGLDYAKALKACREEIVSRLSPSRSRRDSEASNANSELKWNVVGDPGMAALKIYLPRFEVEFGSSLGAALKQAGLTAPFLPGDFTRISSAGAAQLSVSEVIHKVYVKVDEQGTEAAAATAVMMVRSAIMNPPPELFVRFDRPFMFAIVHDPTGLALFSGEVYEPEKWGA